MLIGVGNQVGISGGKPNFATLPEQGGGQTPPSTSYYLQMDGVNDSIKTPQMSFNRVEFDLILYTSANKPMLDLRPDMSGGYVNASTGRGTSSLTLVQGIQSVGTRQTWVIEHTTLATITASAYIYSDYLVSQFVQGDLFSVKFLLNGVTVAYYDMSKGNVQDQSGNNNHATLTGGTWIQM